MTPLTQTQLDGLLTAQTLYLKTPTGEAVIYLGLSGESHARLPNGATMRGHWRLLQDAYAVDWENGPQNSQTRVVRDADSLRLVDAATGDPRGDVMRIVPGNAEGL